MDLYTFKVDRFFINQTRSISDDTLHLAYAAFVDGDNKVAQKLLHLSAVHGDFGNGEYNPDDYVSDADKGGLARVVINDPMSKVAFNFQLLNNNNVPAGALTGRVAATADALAGLSGPAAGIALEAFANFYAWLSVDCDGPVAVDQISGPRYVLDAWTDNVSQTFQVTQKDYPGVDSPTGCGGGNSDYEVSWSLRHSRAWVRVIDETQRQYLGGPPLDLTTGQALGAATHNGAVYAFGVDEAGNVWVARSFTGAAWRILSPGGVYPPCR